MPSCDQDVLKALEAARGPSYARAMQAIKPPSQPALTCWPTPGTRWDGSCLPRQASSILKDLNVLSSSFALVRAAHRLQGARSQDQYCRQLSDQPTSPRQASVASPRTADETLQQNPQHSTDKTWEFDMGPSGLAESQNSRNCHPANPGLPFTVSTSMLGLRDPASKFTSLDLKNAVACVIFRAMLSTARVRWCHETNNGPRQTPGENTW